MDKLLKLEKYQLLHNSIYWCGMIGIFILGFFTADTYVTEVMGSTEEIASSLADIFNGRLTLFIPVCHHFILPGNHIRHCDFVDLPFSKVRKDFCPHNVTFRLKSTFLYPLTFILGIHLIKALKRHIQLISFSEHHFMFPCSRFTLGLESTFLRLLSLPGKIGVSEHHSPCTFVFFLIYSHLKYLLIFFIKQLFLEIIGIHTPRHCNQSHSAEFFIQLADNLVCL